MKRVMNNEIKGILILLFLVVFLLVLFVNTYYAFKYPIKYKEEILTYSKEFDLDSAFVASVINAESRFKSNAISKKGAVGLMQILPSTANFIALKLKLENFTQDDLLDPKTNIRFGCYYLNYLSKKFTSRENILCAYNAGETVVFSWLKNEKYSEDGVALKKIPYKQTNSYVDKVNDSYRYYSKKF